MSTISSNRPVCILDVQCICAISRTQSASETVDLTNESETADPTIESPTAAIPPQSRPESRGSLLRRLRRSESHQPQQEQTPASDQNGHIETWCKMAKVIARYLCCKLMLILELSRVQS